MKKQTIFLFLFILIYGIATAQTAKEICIDKPLKEKDMVYPVLLGKVGKMAYFSGTGIGLNDNGEIVQKNLRLLVYDCESLKLSKVFAVKNSGSVLDDAVFVTASMINDKIYIYWNKNQSQANKLIIQVFDSGLNEIQKPKILYELEENGKKKSQTHFFYMISPDGNKIIIGGEEVPEKNKSLKIQYKVYDKNFNILNTVNAELPYTVKRNSMLGAVSSQYQINNAGNLFFTTNVSIDGAANSSEFGYLIGSINSENSTLNSKLISFENKKINSLNVHLEENGLFVFGTCDNRGKEGSFKNEFFSFTMDMEKIEIKGEMVYSGIDVNNIIYSDCEMSTSEKSKYSKEEYAIKLMNCNLIINEYEKISDGTFLLALSSCGVTENTKISDLNGYILEDIKANYVAKLNQNGKIEWISAVGKKIRQHPLEDDGKGKYFSVYQEELTSDYWVYKIDEQKGVYDKKMIKNMYDELSFFNINGVLYFIKSKNEVVNFGKFEFAE